MADPDFIKNLPAYFRRRFPAGGHGIIERKIRAGFDLVMSAFSALQTEPLKATHIPILGAGRVDGPSGQLPDIEAVNALVYIVFNGVAGSQKVYRTFKIPESYLGEASFHVHWTKSDDVDRSGETVRWIVSYKVFDGRTQDAAATPDTLTFDDTFLDDGTTTRVVQRIPEQLLADPTALYYVTVCVEKGTPASGTPMAAPALVSLDFSYRESVF